MITLLSPAKTLDYSKDFNFQPSVPTFLNDSSKLVKGLKSKEPKDIASLMSLSDKLATLNFERFQSWSAAKKLVLMQSTLFLFLKGTFIRDSKRKIFQRVILILLRNTFEFFQGCMGS